MLKKTKQGLLKLVKTANGYKTITSLDEGFDEAKDELVPVFENGVVLKEWAFEEIREKAKVTTKDTVSVHAVY